MQTAKAIEEAGLERGPAEAIARAIYQRGSDYATRSDIDRLETTIRELAGDVRRLFIAVLAASGGIIAALIAGIVAVIVAA